MTDTQALKNDLEMLIDENRLSKVMPHAHLNVRIDGILGGPIWMPARVCGKQFTVTERDFSTTIGLDRKGNRPTLRDMVLKATNDGDFQSCEIADATVTFERTVYGETRTRTVKRHVDIRQFPSVADCMAELESERYWEIVDCFAEVD